MGRDTEEIQNTDETTIANDEPERNQTIPADLIEEMEILEEEKTFLQKLQETSNELEASIDQVSSELENLSGNQTGTVSVVRPVQSILGLFGTLIGAVTNTVGNIVEETIDVAKQVTTSPEFNQQLENVTKSVNSLVEESSGLFKKVMHIKYMTGDKVLSTFNSSIVIRRVDGDDDDEEEYDESD